MGKSIDFIRNKILSGTTNLSECNFDDMFELDPFEFLTIDKTIGKIFEGCNHDVFYDDNIEFNYFSTKRSRNDGTLLFLYENAKDVIFYVLTAQTYNEKLLSDLGINNQDDMDNLLKSHKLKYTIGNIVCATEYGDEFATEEKPWMKSRFSAFLPIKFEIIER